MTRFEEMKRHCINKMKLKYKENDSLKKKRNFGVLSFICVIYLTLRRVHKFHGLVEFG